MRRLHQGHVGKHSLLDPLTFHRLHGHLPTQLGLRLCPILPFLLTTSDHLQLLNLATIHGSSRPSTTFDFTLRHDVAFATRGKR